jgi:hypothetical protein
VHLGRVSTLRILLAAMPLLLLVPSACAQDEDEDAADEGAPTEECVSGTEWVGGNEESPRMNPGQDCLACHGELGVEKEEVVLAGTVFGGVNERNNCFGVPGVTVQITDATNMVFETVSNEAGNFILSAADGMITPPYSAKLLYEGRERKMAAMQSNLSCNSCHTQAGLNGAPGRILAP